MILEQANKTNSKELCDFFEANPLSGNFDFTYIRNENFFKQYELHQGEYETYFMRDSEANISACASLIFKKSLIQGVEQKIAWLVDLRIGKDRKTIIHWMDLFFSKMLERVEAIGAEHLFSVIFKDNQKSLNSLIRPRSRRRQVPQFVHMKDFNLTSIHGRTPSFESLISSIRVRPLNPNKLEELCLYLNSRAQSRPLGTIYTPELLTERFETWPDFHRKNFFVARDKKKNIVGCYALWDAKQVQKIKLLKLNDYSKNFYTVTKLLSWIKLAKPIGVEGELLNFYYLTHLYADNSDIFEVMIHHAYHRSKNKFLLYQQFEDDWTHLPPKRYLTQSLQFGMYNVIAQNSPVFSGLRTNPFAPPPEIEACLL